MDVGYGFGDVDQVEEVKKGEGIEGAVKEAGVRLAPFVTFECSGCRVLEVCNDCYGTGEKLDHEPRPQKKTVAYMIRLDPSRLSPCGPAPPGRPAGPGSVPHSRYTACGHHGPGPHQIRHCHADRTAQTRQPHRGGAHQGGPGGGGRSDPSTRRSDGDAPLASTRTRLSAGVRRTVR